MQPICLLGALLQELRELRARQDRLCLAERLHFLVAGRLPDFKVLQREVAGLVEIGVLVHELLLLVHGRLLGLLGRDLVRLGRRLLLGLVRDVAGLLLDRPVRVFTYSSYAFCASVSALMASASRVSVSRMICSNMPMTPPDPLDCLYSLKPGGGGGPAGSCRAFVCRNSFLKTAASTS